MKIVQRHVDWWKGYDTLLIAEPPKQPTEAQVERLTEKIRREKPLIYMPIPFEDFLWPPPLRHYPHERWEACNLPSDLSGKTVMDFGANTGYYGWLAIAIGAKAVMVETSSKHCQLMRDVARLYGLGDEVEIQNEYIRPDLIRSGKPDIIFAFSVLPYIGKYEPEKLKAVLRAMAETVPVSYIEMGDGGSELPWCKNGDDQFARLFQGCGFKKVIPLESLFSTHTSTYRMIWRCEGGA